MNASTYLGKLVIAAAGAALLLPLAACGSGSSAGTSDGASDGGGGGGDTSITVLAAASLTTSFTEIGKEFEAAHPGSHVTFSFGGSSDLVADIQNGAPADVFASADTATMGELTKDGSAVAPKDFASNVLEIATPPGNPAHVTGFADLAKPGVKVVVCADGVPCGTAARTVEQQTHVTIHPVSEEQSVTDVLGKVESGDADAGLVYVTDVKAAGSKVTGVSFPEASKVVNTYPIAVLKDAKEASVAQEFVDFVLGAQGQKVLQGAGFGKP